MGNLSAGHECVMPARPGPGGLSSVPSRWLLSPRSRSTSRGPPQDSLQRTWQANVNELFFFLKISEDQLNRMEGPRISLYNYGRLIFHKGAKTFDGAKTFLRNDAGSTGYPHAKE